jgi:predicted permease
MTPDSLGAKLLGFALAAAVGAALPRWRPDVFERERGGALLATLVTEVTFPALSLAVLSRERLRGEVALALVPATVALALALPLAWLTARALRLDRAAQGAFALTATFSNTAFIGLPVTQALFPDPAYAAAALLVDTVDTTLGLWTVGVLIARRFGAGAAREEGLRGALLRPATLSVLLGLSLNAAGLRLPDAMVAALETLGAATTPIVFLFLGMRLDPRGAWKLRGPLSALAAVKLLAMPVIAGLTARALGLRGAAAAVGTLQSAMPTALVAAVIAERAGCDVRLATGAVAVTVPLGVALTVLAAPLLRWLAN